MNLRKVYRIASVLVNSQLRAGRSSSRFSFLRRPLTILVVDAFAFTLPALLLSGVLGLLSSVSGFLPVSLQRLLEEASVQAVVSLPSVVPAFVLIAGIMFELSASSKFASSDAINWLPVSRAEYVAASSLSISYIYSIALSVGSGLTLPLSIHFGLFPAWVAASLLSFVTLLIGGVIVEILRAAVNRVSAAIYKTARRGALVLRLVLLVGVIVAFQLIFNPVVLLNVLRGYTEVINITWVIPLIWPSLAVMAIIEGDVARLALFSSSTVFFALAMIGVAVRVRSKFWSPYLMSIRVTRVEYAPRAGFLSRLGFSPVESGIIRKDLKGLTRRRELIQILAIPAVMLVFVAFPAFSTPTDVPRAATRVSFFSLWFVVGIFSTLFSSISIGQEGKAILNIYSLPVSSKQLLKAKVTSSLIVSLPVTLALLLVVSLVSKFEPRTLFAALALSLAIAVENTFIGLGFATRFPDFADRPRPYFVQLPGMLGSTFLGLIIALATASPILVQEAVSSFLVNFGIPFELLVGLALVLAAVVSFLGYLWANSGAFELLRELRA